MRLAFIAYTRPLLEYNSIIWNPNLVSLINLIENIQRNFTKRISTLASLPYSERLALLDLNLLEQCKIRFDLILCYILINHLIPFKPPAMFWLSTHQLSALEMKCRIYRNQPMPQTASYQLSSSNVLTCGTLFPQCLALFTASPHIQMQSRTNWLSPLPSRLH